MKNVHGNAKSTMVIKNGRLIMANSNKARVFGSKIKALAFVRNLIGVSNSLRMKDFEFVTIG